MLKVKLLVVIVFGKIVNLHALDFPKGYKC